MGVNKGARVRRWWAAAVAVAALVLGVGIAQAPTPAVAYSAADFDPGYIISDEAFYDSNAMTEQEIQAFLTGIRPNCINSNCLSILRTDTFSRPADRNICTAYQGAAGELASTILFKVQQACGISAKVLLVTLQKEQSLITSSAPSFGTLARAMGYGCPDSAGGACDANFYGFYNQVYKAAWQFKRYSTPDPWGNYQPGWMDILYNPDPGCGITTVHVKNNATAALYNYTPYVPNAAALANLHGLGDGCSSYGNRNFWVYYNEWFGDPLVRIPEGVTVSRVGGADRYDVAVGISQRNFSPGTGVVYVATGSNYPDALSAAPAAALQGAPLLLVPTDNIPANVRAEIQRLAPTQIVVVGGPASVSDAVYEELATLAPNIRRETGADRYVVSESVTRNAFASGATQVYLATGWTFPDALSASAAAGSKGAPVILVDGLQPSVTAEVATLLADLGVTSVLIAGGPASVTPQLETGLRSLPGITEVRRLTGADRYVVSGVTNRDAFSATTRVYIASGEVYPDALSGAAVAGAQSAPLYVVPRTCIPSYVIDDIINFGASEMVILGGPGSVDPSVERFYQCR